jgi:hypothetical protein
MAKMSRAIRRGARRAAFRFGRFEVAASPEMRTGTIRWDDQMPVKIAVNKIIIWYGIRYVYGDVVMLPFKLAVELQARGIAV